MQLAIDDFLHSLATWLVATAATLPTPATIIYAAANAGLFRHEAPENAADPNLVSVISVYGGPGRIRYPMPKLNVQCATFGTSNKAAMTRSQTLFDCGLNADGTPLTMVKIPGYHAADNSADAHWMLVAIDVLNRPGLVGRDLRNRAKVIFNWQVSVNKLNV